MRSHSIARFAGSALGLKYCEHTINTPITSTGINTGASFGADWPAISVAAVTIIVVSIVGETFTAFRQWIKACFEATHTSCWVLSTTVTALRTWTEANTLLGLAIESIPIDALSAL